MKAFKAVLCLAAVTTIPPLLAHAQSVVLQVNVPFDFLVGKTLMPAGHYEVEELFTPDDLVIFSQHHSAMIRTQPIESPAGTGHTARLLFRNFNGRFALAEVWGNDQTFRSGRSGRHSQCGHSYGEGQCGRNQSRKVSNRVSREQN